MARNTDLTHRVTFEMLRDESRWLDNAAATVGTTTGDVVRTILRGAMRPDYGRQIVSPVQALAVAYREAQERIECAQETGA
jgi:hypothetical protein